MVAFHTLTGKVILKIYHFIFSHYSAICIKRFTGVFKFVVIRFFVVGAIVTATEYQVE